MDGLSSLTNLFGKFSDLQPKYGLSAGFYSCTCNRCKESFQGQKRSYECADCAYDKSIDRSPPTKEDLEHWTKMLDDITGENNEK